MATFNINQPSSSALQTPPPVSTYPNLPQPTPGQLSTAQKTRRPLGERDSIECRRVLTEVFGHSEYKGKQKEIVESAYGGADVLVVAPTGMGKSLCFQIPAIADKRGLSLVISPLLALMQNQLESLRLKNVEVAALNSQTSPYDKARICTELRNYDVSIKLLYATPERMSTDEFLSLLDEVYENHNLNRLIVDEAHCISEWGHDFRAEYRRLGRFRERYPDVPIIALTATATSSVQRDIIRSLKLEEDKLFTALHPFNRSNLFYEVRYLSNPQQLNQMTEIFDYITTLYRRRGKPSSGIIYCRHRKTCDDVSSYLRGKGLNARPYHRGIPSATLDKTLKNWTKGTSGQEGGVDVVVATIAFGLGIDKGDVRYVIHFDLPKSFEGYYQETGRAGRDGHPSKCVLYYSREDAIRVKKYVHSNPNGPRDNDEPTPTQRASGSLDALIAFAESTILCRHVSICRYFGEPIDENDKELVGIYCTNMCDVCKYPDKTKDRSAKLSSNQAAVSNVPFMRTVPSSSSSAPQAWNQRQGDWSIRQQDDQRQSPFGAQKRGPNGSIDGQGGAAPLKKPKVAHTKMLVTKPFGSTAGLSKPFRAPTFVQRPSKEVSSPAPQPPRRVVSPRVPSPRPEWPTNMSTDGIDDSPPADRESSPIELPDVDMGWDPEHSAKASYNERQKAVKALRTSFHKILFPTFETDELWSKIHSKPLDNERRHHTIFKVAETLDASAILLSSTLNGYKDRIASMKSDIRALSNLDMWDSDDADFEDSQEVIQLLRQHALPPDKGKRRAR